MKKIYFALALGAMLALVPGARSTTVIAPTFDQLVDDAETIFQGSVTGVQSLWVGEGAQRHIVTYVTFLVEDAVKGTAGPTYTMRMFGGTVDGMTMAVSDAPKFNVGDRNILFVEHNGTQFIPLVGIMHGQFRVDHDPAGNEVVVRADGVAVRDVSRLGREESSADGNMAVMSSDQFKSAIRAHLQASNQPTQ